MAGSYRLQVRVGPRDLARFPAGDDALGEAIFGLLTASLARGLPRPAMLTLLPDQIQQFDVLPLLQAGVPDDTQRMLSAIAGQPGVECAALAGTLQVQRGPQGQPQRALVCFLEWPDNRWWTSWQLVGDDRQPVGDAATRRAIDGWPRPGGVGAWFSTARRLGLRLRLDPSPGETVH